MSASRGWRKDIVITAAVLAAFVVALAAIFLSVLVASLAWHAGAAP